MSNDHDVLVVGGGMVGAALAALLHASRFRVAVIERAEPVSYSVADDMDLRVSALSLASRRILAAAGAWPAIAAARCSPYQAMHVWQTAEAGGAGDIRFDAADLGVAELGHIVENRLIQSALQSVLQRASDVSWFAPASPEQLLIGDERVSLVLDDGRELRARLVVGADGAASLTRDLAGIATRAHDYQQRGIVAHIASELPHGETARQRFLADGPLAFLPLSDGRCSIVWSTSDAEAERLLALEPAAFEQALGDASANVLGKLSLSSQRAAFPLRRQHADRYTLDRVALVGDAAHSVHPLAGLGVNLGLADAAALVQVLEDARADGADPGDTTVLRRYERWRRAENVLAMATLDGLHRLFSNADPVLGRLRGWGLGFVDRSGPLKTLFARHAMGLAGDLPRIVRDAQ